MMPRPVWERTLNEVKQRAFVIQFYFQGEPLLNKDLPLMIREAHEAGLYTIVSTNAQALTETLATQLVNAGLDRIIISMDGLTESTYNAYRIGGSLEKTQAALRYLREAKDKNQKAKICIELQCLRLKSNEHEWHEFKSVYKSLGADVLTFKTAQLYNYHDGHPLMPSNPRYSRYIKGSDGRYHRRPLRRGCFRVWSGVVVTTTGDVLPCCYDKAHDYAYGNIMNTSLKDLFGNDKATAFRRAAFRQTPQICQECYQ
jgi:radical SAM protein with 4Fe4S-binding SPASM domain